MKEEAKKQRIMTARAAKLPHMSRSEYRVSAHLIGWLPSFHFSMVTPRI